MGGGEGRGHVTMLGMSVCTAILSDWFCVTHAVGRSLIMPQAAAPSAAPAVTSVTAGGGGNGANRP